MKKVYILEESKLLWDESEVRAFRKMWNSGKSVVEISEALNVKVLDVSLLVIDQAERRKIMIRK